MIFYFSGTGNSQWVAKQMAKTSGDELVSIPQCWKEGRRDTFSSQRPLVFVAPTYAWRLPRVVEEWLRKTRFEGNRDAYFVLTCGGSCGNAAAYAQKLCVKKGFRFCGLAPVVMPENYLALFPTPSASVGQDIIDKAKPTIAALSAQIKAGECFPERSPALKDKLQSGPVNSLFYAFTVRDRGFTVSPQKCISCGKCSQRCPLNNIDLVEGRPLWQGNCTHCMACIGGCPTEAIEYKNKSQGRHRHYIMEDDMA